MSSRKEVRDWFKAALSSHESVLGKVYPLRVVEFEDESDQPERFTNVYVSEGDIQQSDEGGRPLMLMTLEMGFNLRSGKDDDLDHCEFIADRALKAYAKGRPPPFSFYKERFNYSGDAEDAYEQLYVTYQIITPYRSL